MPKYLQNLIVYLFDPENQLDFVFWGIRRNMCEQHGDPIMQCHYGWDGCISYQRQEATSARTTVKHAPLSRMLKH